MKTEVEQEPYFVQGSGRVLLVDDMEAVIEIGKEWLEFRGYQVATANNGLEAVNFYREKWRDIDIIVLDVDMPVMDGLEALKIIREINPSAKVLMQSGFFTSRQRAELRVESIAKPWKMNELSKAINNVLSAPDSSS